MEFDDIKPAKAYFSDVVAEWITRRTSDTLGCDCLLYSVVIPSFGDLWTVFIVLICRLVNILFKK